MKCFLLAFYLIFLLDSVLGSLPAPVNVSVSSLNFHHVLRWDPGPGTPPGTQYKIFKRVNSREEKQQDSKETSVRLKLKKNLTYFLTVQASYNQTLSPKSHKVSFSPYQDTKISPPKLSLAGCGDCIQINVSLHKTVQKFCNPTFRVLWRKANDAVNDYKEFEMRDNSYTLKNLENGEQYCVQVRTLVILNQNTEPSAWTCTFTSIVEPRRVDVVVGAVVVLVIFVVSALTSFMFCLHYTGFFVKVKALPQALIVRHMTLVSGKILNLETTIPDLISISSETDKRNKCRYPTMPQPATRATSSGEAEEEEEEDDEEEEDEEKNAYMDRNAGFSSGESSYRDSHDVSGNSALPASVRLSAEVEEVDEEFGHEGLDQYEAKGEGAEVSFMPEGGQTEVQGHVTGEEEEEEDMKEKEEGGHTSGNINLFSVTLAALPVGEEEEEEENTIDSLTDFLKHSDLELPLLTDSKRTLSHKDSQTESDDQTTVALMQPTPKDVNETGYESRCAHTLSGCLKASDGESQEEEEEEEEEEEFSGYMGRT